MMRMMNHWAHDQDPLEPLLHQPQGVVHTRVAHLRPLLLPVPHPHPPHRQPLRSVTLIMSARRGVCEEGERQGGASGCSRIEAAAHPGGEASASREAAQPAKGAAGHCERPHHPALPLAVSPTSKSESEHVHLQAHRLAVSSTAAILASPPSRHSRPLSLHLLLSAQPSTRHPTSRLPSQSSPLRGRHQRLRVHTSAVQLPGVARSHLRPYFPLFTSFLTDIGAGPYDYRQLSHLIDLYTGGIGCVTASVLLIATM